MENVNSIVNLYIKYKHTKNIILLQKYRRNQYNCLRKIQPNNHFGK